MTPVDMLTIEVAKGVHKEGFGVKHPRFKLDFYKNFIAFAKTLNCFIFTFCLLICRLNTNTTE